MAVDVDICNSAMIKVGAALITAFTDNTKEARLCNHQYPRVRDAILRSAPWSFATKRVALTAAVVTLEFGDETVFQLPADCVKVWKLDDPTAKFKVEGRRLLTSDITDTLNLWYISNAATPADYDAAFQEAVACALAADLAYPLTQSDSLKQGLLQQTEFYINQARSYNSQEGTPDNFTFDTFLNSRVAGHEIY